MRSALLEKFNSYMLSVLSIGKTGNGAQKFSGRRNGSVRIVWQMRVSSRFWAPEPFVERAMLTISALFGLRGRAWG
jgi:hypothetical protein